PAIKTPDQWWLLGKPLKRLDVEVKSNGSATYAIDVQVPGMVYAAVKACPVPWGKLAGYDDSAVNGRPGIHGVFALKAVPGKTENDDLQDCIAVVADSWWQAKNAFNDLRPTWDVDKASPFNTALLRTDAKRLLEQTGEVVAEGSDTLAAIAAGGKVVTADY